MLNDAPTRRRLGLMKYSKSHQIKDGRDGRRALAIHHSDGTR